MEESNLIKDVLEYIYLLSAPILVYFAYKGLGQIKEAKKNHETIKDISKIQSLRDSYKISGEQCKFFADTIIPTYSKFREELKENNCTFFEKFEVDIENKNVITKIKDGEKITDEDIESLKKLTTLTELLNFLESFSMYFASGVASEKAGYITAGRGYCELVEPLMPFLLIRIKKGYYKNIGIIFTTWKNKCAQDDIKKKQKELEKEFNKTTSMSINEIGNK